MFLTLGQSYRTGQLWFKLVVLVALAFLVPAHPSAAAGDRSAELQEMVNDLNFQLDLMSRYDQSAASKRRKQVESAIGAWNRSARGDAEFEIMQHWLTTSIKRSLPPSSASLPSSPRFPVERQELARPNDIEPSTTASPRTHEPEVVTPVVPRVERAPRPIVSTQPFPSEALPKLARRNLEGNPFVDDPILPTQSPANARRGGVQLAAMSMASPEQSAQLNVVELGARIRGFVRGLQRLEGKLFSQQDLTADELLRMARELEQLAEQREFVDLYRQSLAGDHRNPLPELPTCEQAKQLLVARLADRRKLEKERVRPTMSALQEAEGLLEDF